jgi:cytochrome c biogenesis factor
VNSLDSLLVLASVSAKAVNVIALVVLIGVGVTFVVTRRRRLTEAEAPEKRERVLLVAGILVIFGALILLVQALN